MPTAEHFAKSPPFPNNVPIAKIPRISLAKILANDVAESEALFRAGTDTGFLLLDFKGSPDDEVLLNEVGAAFQISKNFFDCSLDEKSKYPIMPSNLGYKRPGLTKIENGKPDRCEIYGVAQDDLLGLSTQYTNPPAFENSRETLTSCAKHMHSIVSALLSTLDKHLDMPPGTLASWHPLTTPSPSCLRFPHMPPQPTSDQQTSLLGHTDNGTITILFNIIGGLQIQPPNTNEWLYVRPEPGCAIVNFGDALTQWTGGVLRSCMHRVVPLPPGAAQAECDRYSVAYVLKPPNEARMDRWRSGSVIPRLEEGEGDVGDCTYGEFHRRKGKAYEAGKNLVGGTGGAGEKKEKGSGAPPDVMIKEVDGVH